MPNYVPCRTDEDDNAHLRASAEPDRTLCGKAIVSGPPSDDELPACPDCAKRLLARTLQNPGPGRRITSVEITVHS
jgi:hypothetical protein